jgi:hypothetical protein
MATLPELTPGRSVRVKTADERFGTGPTIPGFFDGLEGTVVRVRASDLLCLVRFREDGTPWPFMPSELALVP